MTKTFNKDDIKIARQCMNFQNLRCNNKDCTNESCPLNKIYDSPKTNKTSGMK